MSKLNVLLVDNNTKYYIAKVWWSIQKGLSQICNLYTFGKDQMFNQEVKTYSDILNLLSVTPDLMITNFNAYQGTFWYEGIENIKCKKAVIVGDYWSLHPDFMKNIANKVDYVFSFFYEFTIDNPFYFLPPSVDTDIFKDWKEEKQYLVGFLGVGCNNHDSNYPSRYRITELLKKRYKDFYWAPHPGWGNFAQDDPALVGVNFSKAINRCKMCVNTSGIIGHCNPKYIEFSASGSMLLAGQCKHLDKIHFKDGFNCVQFNTDEELIEKIDYYILHDNERNMIISNAMKTIEQYHTSEIRAKELLEVIK